MGDGEIAGRQHHRVALHAAGRGDQLGVAHERGVAELGRLFVHRHGHDAGDCAGEGVVGGAQHVVAGCGTRGSIDDAGAMIVGAQHGGVDDLQHTGSPQAWIEDRLHVDIEAEQPGTVAQDREHRRR